MKSKFVYLFLLSSLVALLFFSCNDKSNKLEDVVYTDKSGSRLAIDVDIANIISEDFDYYYVRIGLGASGYRLDKTNRNVEQYIDFIKNSFAEERPVKLFIKKGTSEIESVQEPSELELNKWKSSPRGEVWKNTIETVPRSFKDYDSSLQKSNSDYDFDNYSEIQNIFNIIKSETCDNSPFTYEYGCISFNLKRDGCYARAHKMRQIIENEYSGKSCLKLFVYSDGLKLNVPGCSFKWSYHVAPVVRDISTSMWYVLDPSLNSSNPLTTLDWTSIMGLDNICSIDLQSPEIYAPKIQECNVTSYATDDSYSSTNSILFCYQNLYGCDNLPYHCW